MTKENSQRTEELIARLKKLRESKKEAGQHQSSDGLSEVAQKIDAEIVKISQELKSEKFKQGSGDLNEKEADALLDELLDES